MFGLGWSEMMIVGVIAVLLFGKRLPEVARSLGKGVVEFKKGLRDVTDEFDGAKHAAIDTSTTYRDDVDDRQSTSAPKFEPPTEEPQAAETTERA
jgi:sec-independent protein translocase protein TatA